MNCYETLRKMTAELWAKRADGLPHVDSFIDCVHYALGMLTCADVPTPEWATEAIQGSLNKREWKKGRVLFIQRGRNDKAECFLRAARWLRSGGNLHGPIIARMQFGSEDCGKADTLALVIRNLQGLRTTPAIDAWKRTGVI